MEALLKSVQCNSDMVRLDLSYNLIDDQGVINVCQTVASLPHLKALNLCGNLLTVDGFMKMENQFSVSRVHLAELSELNLSFNNITDAGVKHVSRMCGLIPKLTKLSLKSCHLSTLDNHNAAFDQLTSLDVGHNSFKNLESLWTNLRLDRIRELNFDLALSDSYSTFPRELVDYLKSGSSSNASVCLERLSLANCGFTDSLVWELVQSLKASSNLKSLCLMNNPNLSTVSLKSVLNGRLPLDELNLRACPQIATDLKVSELIDCALPRRLILSLSNVEDKSSLAAALKDLWQCQFAGQLVRIEEQTTHTLIISCLPE